MTYSAEISRANPSMFLFLLDQSGSMADPFAGGGGKKDQKVADAINNLLFNLTIKCAKSEGVRDYYHVGVIGYGEKVGPALGGELAGKELVPISKIADAPERIEERTKKVDDGAGGLVEQKVRFPIWFSPVSKGGTPMSEALKTAQQIVARLDHRAPRLLPADCHQHHRRRIDRRQPAQSRRSPARTAHVRMATCCCSTSTCPRKAGASFEFPEQRRRAARPVRQAVVRHVQPAAGAHSQRGSAGRLSGRRVRRAASSSTPTSCR